MNKIIRNLIIQPLILTLLLASCERTDSNFCHQMGRESGYLSFQTIEELSSDSIHLWLTVSDTVLWFEPIFYRIDDQETFNNLVNCNCESVNINFQDYTLLRDIFLNSLVLIE